MKFKKILCIIFVGVMFTFGLVGCISNNGNGHKDEICTHSYTTSVIDPTCTSRGYTLHSCSLCGDNYKDSYIEATGHTYVENERNYVCTKCDKSECEGFTFKTATYNGEYCYVVTNATANTLISGKLEVPRKYESLPVRGIMTYSFSGIAKQVKTLIIHDNIKNIYSYLWNGTSIWNSDLSSESTLETIIFDSTCKDIRIEANAFYNCTKLENINISKGMVLYAPADAVMSTNGGNAEYLFKGTPYFKNNAIIKNGLYYVADLLLHADPNEISSSISIDTDTVLINAALFARITFVKSVTIPNTIKSIGEKAFYGCSELETIIFKGTIAEFNAIAIGSSVFSGTKAKSIVCNDGIVTSYKYNGYTYKIGD